MKKVLLFGAGKSATTLIHFLASYCQEHQHQFIVCDQDVALAQAKIAGFTTSAATDINVTTEAALQAAVASADLVISLLPPALHIMVAKECLRFYKPLLTASYVDEQMENLAEEIERRGILFVAEMGLDPGIDHMSAMKIIDDLRSNNARITSFYSHCGGLVAPESDDNPWHYKITWNPMNVVMAGSGGARYLENGQQKEISYQQVFGNEDQLIRIDDIGDLAWYANRDSLSYLHTYKLDDLKTFIRTTLRYPSYDRAWNVLVQLRLTDTNDGDFVAGCATVKDWFTKKTGLLKQAQPDNPVHTLLKSPDIQHQLEFLGCYSDEPLVAKANSAEVLLMLLQEKLVMKPHDRDMIVMVHEVDYEVNSKKERLTSTLIVKGTDSLHTAMSKTVGTPLAILATLILEGKINLTGLHIPVIPEIYIPVLERLAEEGIAFTEIKKAG